MLRYGHSFVFLVLTLPAVGLWSSFAVADAPRSISPFISSSVERTIRGDTRALELSAAGRKLGRAQAFAGVDTLSTASRQYLTSGVQWRASRSDATRLNLTALRTESRGDLRDGQTLARAESALGLGGQWYMPELTAEMARVSSMETAGRGQSGRAARVGLAEAIGNARVSLGYFQADQDFDALGSALAPGDRGVALDGRYAVGNAWHLAHDLRLHQTTAARRDPTLVQEWAVSRNTRLTDIGDPWRLSARIGDADDPAVARNKTPVALELATQSAHWRSWRLDSSLGWYDGAARAPQDLPVAGALWQVSASRGLDIAGWRTRVSPRLTIGGSRYRNRRLASRTGLTFGLASLSDNIDLSFDYRSAGWTPASRDDGDMQMTVNYSQSAGGIIPGLASVIQHLRLPWQKRR